MRVALVHDVLNQLGGAERVLANFLEIWPDATIFTAFYDEQKTQGQFARFTKKVSFLNNLPLSHIHPRLFVTLLPWAFESFNFNDFDVVISDSSAFAKFAKPKNKLHISYIHTPTRFLWIEPEYLDKQRYPYLFRLAGKFTLPWLRRKDYKAAQRPNFLIANSVTVQDRIKNFYHRESVVIPPPVDTLFYQTMGIKKDYFLIVTRLEPYKKVDIIIEAFNRLGWPLKIVGSGTIIDDLKKIAQGNVEFLGRIPETDLKRYYAEAKAFVYATEEDAGIALLEAQSAGTPVVAYGKGGALESVIADKTGEFFYDQTPESLITALQNFDASHYSREDLRNNALRFSKQKFQAQIRDFVEEKYREYMNK
ncbi:MAG: glycosyltransferase [Candidatus Doudnabacteria bacterium]|nr:glycosyltransferase [Candidatus Doudnabacteria bacterium]